MSWGQTQSRRIRKRAEAVGKDPASTEPPILSLPAGGENSGGLLHRPHWGVEWIVPGCGGIAAGRTEGGAAQIEGGAEFKSQAPKSEPPKKGGEDLDRMNDSSEFWKTIRLAFGARGGKTVVFH
jgi:hypothetical protein